MSRHFHFLSWTGAMMILLWSSMAWAAVDLDSRITRVSLYADQALVTRRAETRISPGIQTLRLGIAAFEVDPDAAAARVQGQGTIVGVQLKSVPLEQAPQPQIEALEKQIEERRRALRKLQDQKQGLTKQERFLEGFLSFSQDQIGRELATRLPSAEELGNTLAFLASSYGEIYTAQQSLDLAMDEIQRELTRLEKELAALQDSSTRSRRVLEILFDSTQSQTVLVEADYLVLNTRWDPLYKAAVPSTLESAELTLLARIVQKSGEDWNDVALEISNAVPTRGAALPEISTWWLDVPRPLGRAKAAGAEFRGTALDAEMAPMAAEPAPAPMAQARRERSTLAVAYLPATPVTIPSRAQETVIPLETKPLSGAFYHYAVPKNDPRAFLVCELKADSELLPGPLNVYFDGRYLGRTQLAEQAAGKTFRLNLGIDREVKLKRRKLTDTVKETYFGKIDRDSVVRQIEYRIDMVNTKERPITLQLRDHLPIPRTDRIKVKDIQLNPEPKTRSDNDREGVALWELNLAPGETREVKLEFVVIHPKDMVLPVFR